MRLRKLMEGFEVNLWGLIIWLNKNLSFLLYFSKPSCVKLYIKPLTKLHSYMKVGFTSKIRPDIRVVFSVFVLFLCHTQYLNGSCRVIRVKING